MTSLPGAILTESSASVQGQFWLRLEPVLFNGGASCLLLALHLGSCAHGCRKHRKVSSETRVNVHPAFGTDSSWGEGLD